MKLTNVKKEAIRKAVHNEIHILRMKLLGSTSTKIDFDIAQLEIPLCRSIFDSIEKDG